PAPAPRFRARRAREMPASTGHVAWFTTGFVLLGAGATFAVLAAMKSAPALTGALLALGLSPGLVLACGLAALGAGTLLARHGRQAAALADLESTLHDLLVVADQVDATTRALREADESRASAAMSGDEISQVLFALQRHEEKLTNLTKATKTFGKPLVEMTTQMADATAQVAQIQSTLQALRVVAENGFQRSEETLRTHAEVLRQCNEQLANDSLQPALA